MRSLQLFFFFNDTATTEIYTLSLHDALPICFEVQIGPDLGHSGLKTDRMMEFFIENLVMTERSDRKSTRLNSSHGYISYAVFCLKKKKKVNYQSQSVRLLSQTTIVIQHSLL